MKYSTGQARTINQLRLLGIIFFICILILLSLLMISYDQSEYVDSITCSDSAYEDCVETCYDNYDDNKSISHSWRDCSDTIEFFDRRNITNSEFRQISRQCFEPKYDGEEYVDVLDFSCLLYECQAYSNELYENRCENMCMSWG